jgi:hypothetical protein
LFASCNHESVVAQVAKWDGKKEKKECCAICHNVAFVAQGCPMLKCESMKPLFEFL